jgi:hypothetical protein
VTARREPRCTWIAPSEDPEARLLVPGCMERVQDWDADCTCKTSAEELDELEARVKDLEAQLDRALDRAQAFSSAVLEHQDAAALFKEADESFREWRKQKAAVRRENDNPSLKEIS